MVPLGRGLSNRQPQEVRAAQLWSQETSAWEEDMMMGAGNHSHSSLAAAGWQVLRSPHYLVSPHNNPVAGIPISLFCRHRNSIQRIKP